MALFIERISETADQVTRTRLPGYFGDGHAAIEAMEKVLSAYDRRGWDDEQGYWWARDRERRVFRFVISGV